METNLKHGALEDVELFQPRRRERKLDGEISVRVCGERFGQLGLDQCTLGSLISVDKKALHVNRDRQQLVRVLLTGHRWCRAPKIVRRVHDMILPVLPGNDRMGILVPARIVRLPHRSQHCNSKESRSESFKRGSEMLKRGGVVFTCRSLLHPDPPDPGSQIYGGLEVFNPSKFRG